MSRQRQREVVEALWLLSETVETHHLHAAATDPDRQIGGAP